METSHYCLLFTKRKEGIIPDVLQYTWATCQGDKYFASRMIMMMLTVLMATSFESRINKEVPMINPLVESTLRKFDIFFDCMKG